MSFNIPLVYPITDTTLSGLTHGEQAARLTSAGCRFLQIREKQLPAAGFLAEVRKAISAAPSAHIIVNDRVDIAMALAVGVHLGQDDMPVEAARKLLGGDAIIGLSTHNEKQAAEGVKLPINYLAIGPIFATSTKLDTETPVGLEGISRIREIVGEISLVAIGGIDLSNIRSVIDAGADSAAVISSVLVPHDSIAQNYERLWAETERV